MAAAPIPDLKLTTTQDLAQQFQTSAGAPINISYGSGAAGAAAPAAAGGISAGLLVLALGVPFAFLGLLALLFAKKRREE